MSADTAMPPETPQPPNGRLRIALIVLAAGLTIAAAPAQPGNADLAFVSLANASMSQMMVGMSTQPSGQVDRDFADMMIPHHQGAIDMAQAELRYGTDQTLRRMAQEIIVDQQQEIVAMRAAEKDLK